MRGGVVTLYSSIRVTSVWGGEGAVRFPNPMAATNLSLGSITNPLTAFVSNVFVFLPGHVYYETCYG